MNTKSIMLYGSYSKGCATADSDIDVAVVVDSVPGDYLDSLSLLWRLGRSISTQIEPVLLTYNEKDGGLLQTVERTGVAL